MHALLSGWRPAAGVEWGGGGKPQRLQLLASPAPTACLALVVERTVSLWLTELLIRAWTSRTFSIPHRS